MIYQTDSEFIEEIQEFGCLHLSMAYYKTKYMGYEWDHKELNALWVKAKELKYINDQNIIVDYVGMISLLGLPLKYLDKHSPISDYDPNYYYGITKWHNQNNDYNHFVVGHKKPVEYDPYKDTGSKTVREGYPVDMRFFERLVA